jgi:hypothetical protein
MWLKWKSTCLACDRPQVQNSLLKKKKVKFHTPPGIDNCCLPMEGLLILVTLPVDDITLLLRLLRRDT